MPWAIQTLKNAKRCLNSRILAVEKAKGWPFKWPGLYRAGPSEGQPSLGMAVSEVSLLASSQMPAFCRAGLRPAFLIRLRFRALVSLQSIFSFVRFKINWGHHNKCPST